MKNKKLSVAIEQDNTLNERIGKFCVDVVNGIIAAQEEKDELAEQTLTSLFDQAWDAARKNDLALFEEAEFDFEVYKTIR